MVKIARVKLTQSMVDRLQPVTKETWTMDSEVVGLGVRQRPGSSAVYAIRWKDRDSRDRKFRIGPTSIKLDDARKIARQRLGEVAQGENPLDTKAKERGKVTVSVLAEAVAEELASRGRAARYVRDFRQQWRDHLKPSIGTKLVREVTSHDLDRLLAKYRDRAALHNRLRAALSVMFKLAIRWGYRADDPTYGATRMAEQVRERLLDQAELDALLKALERNPGQSSDAVRLLALTGARPQELFTARWKDFDLAERKWSRPAQYVKQRRRQVVELHPAAAAELKRIREEQEERAKREMKSVTDDCYVFPSSGKSGHLTTVKKHFAKIAREAGISDVRPYDLRKAFASRLLASGADIKTVMSLTGHTQVQVLLKHYAHVMPNKQGEALEKALGGLVGGEAGSSLGPAP